MEIVGYNNLTGDTGVLMGKMSQQILDEIGLKIKEIQNDFSQATPVNYKLEGQIDKEYEIFLPNKATQDIREMVGEYYKHNPRYMERQASMFKHPPKLNYTGEGWVNFQKKYEYNPLHNHSGLLSYVIWYQIPFYRENEIKFGAGGGKKNQITNANGDFNFMFHDGNKIMATSLNVDKHMEGHIALFPSELNHVVYPFFTSDDYRITISGNIFFSI